MTCNLSDLMFFSELSILNMNIRYHVTIIVVLELDHFRSRSIWYVEVWELKLYFYPSAGGWKKKKHCVHKLHRVYQGINTRGWYIWNSNPLVTQIQPHRTRIIQPHRTTKSIPVPGDAEACSHQPIGWAGRTIQHYNAMCILWCERAVQLLGVDLFCTENVASSNPTQQRQIAATAATARC